MPNDSRVIEFGAGNRVLERYLDPSCTYAPSDLVDRGPGTVVCNLNHRPLPDLGDGHYDVAVLLGVLEYLRDLPTVVDWLAKHFPVCVVSYACSDARRYSPRRLYAPVGRLTAGWMNSYRDAELRAIFRERGFVLLHEEGWQSQRLFVFSQRPSTVTP